MTKLNLTLIDTGFDGVFSEVSHSEKLESLNPCQLRLFQLNVKNNEFSYNALTKFLLRNIGQYIFSRERIQGFATDEEIMLIGLKAVKLLTERTKGDPTWLGDELGGLLLYTFLEGVLKAPKLFNRFDTPKDDLLTGGIEGVHLFQPDTDSPSFQMVYGKSRIVGDIRDAIDDAFLSIEETKKDTSLEMRFVEPTVLGRSFSLETATYLRDIILPSKTSAARCDSAFGVFIGYTLGLDRDKYSSVQFLDALERKMRIDIQNHVSYIQEKIKISKMERYPFYLYFLPLNDADNEKFKIMETLIGGGL